MFPSNQKRVPHISPAFGEMWELTTLEPGISITQTANKLKTADLSTALRAGRDDKFAKY
jgi:hypothetical protein